MGRQGGVRALGPEPGIGREAREVRGSGWHGEEPGEPPVRPVCREQNIWIVGMAQVDTGGPKWACRHVARGRREDAGR